MIINKIEIENFRNIKNMCVDIDKSIVLIQSKDIHATSMYSLGKTNFLNAILWCFCKKIKYGGVDVNMDTFFDFKNKRINEFNISVKITFKDESGQTYQAQRIVKHTYQKKSDKSLKIEGGYYTTEELFFNEKAYSFGDLLDKTKDFILPHFIDNFGDCAMDRYGDIIKNEIEKANNNQIFITSYDNHSSEPIVQNILNELKKDYQIITVNKKV